MKNLSVTVVVTALVAFSLGYFARGPVERAPSISKDPEELTVREHTESPATQAQTIVRADPREVDAPLTTSLDRKAVLTSTSSTPREMHAANKRRRLGDFFVINGIGADRAEQIVQDLIEADHNRVQKQNAMIDRHIAKKAELIAQGVEVGINLSAEEKAELRTEKETLYRKIFGEYYEALEEYNRSYAHRMVVRNFSSMLSGPLEYTTGESMVQIMYEENSRRKSDLLSAMAGSSGAYNKESYNEQLLATRSYNERVLKRTRPYLTSSQFEQFKKLLDNDIRRTELYIELEDVGKAH